MVYVLHGYGMVPEDLIAASGIFENYMIGPQISDRGRFQFSALNAYRVSRSTPRRAHSSVITRVLRAPMRCVLRRSKP